MALEERDYRFSIEKKAQIHKQLLEEKALPFIPYMIEKISYLDGLKIYLITLFAEACRYSVQ